jgi:O-antigen/teichoic acid export membrane protein
MFKKFFGINLVNSLLGVLTGVILARNLEPETRGAVGQIVLLSTYAISVSSTSIRDMLLSQKKDSMSINKYNMIISLCLLIIVPITTLYIYDYNQYFLFVCAFGAVSYYNSIKLSVLQVKGDFVKLSLVKIVIPISYLSQLLLFYKSMGISDVLTILVISNVICALLLYSFDLKIKYDNNYDVNKIKSYISVVFAMVVIVISGQFDKFSLPVLISKTEFAYYMIAMTLISTPLSVMGDSVSNYIIVKVKEKIDEKFLLLVYLAFISFSIITVVVVYYLSDFVVPILFGESYISAKGYIMICGLISLNNNCRQLITSIIRGVGDNFMVLKLNMLLLTSLVILMSVMILFEVPVLDAMEYSFICSLALILLISYKEIKIRFY